MTLLIASAAKFEVEPLLQTLTANNVSYDYFSVGVGALSAAASRDKFSTAAKNKNVIFAGSCGVFGSFEEKELVIAEAVSWSPIGERHGLSYGIAGLAPTIDLSASIPQPINLKQAHVLCAPSISMNNKIPEELKGRLFVENLELYSIADLLKSEAKSFVAILGVTNAIGPDAHVQWKENFPFIAQMTADYIEKERTWNLF